MNILFKQLIKRNHITSDLNRQLQHRNAGTLREIQMRLKSVSNISKITKSMKMIASTKLSRAQRAMENAREYGKTSQSIMKYFEPTFDKVKDVNLTITVSSDRGLCGGIHSSVSKATKRSTKENDEIIVLGDKAKAQIMRDNKHKLKYTFSQIGKAIPTFLEASDIATFVSFEKTKAVQIIFNKFVSVISYEPKFLYHFNAETIKESKGYTQFEFEDDVLENYQLFILTNSIFWSLVEGHAAEMAAKRTAMENATKNAEEMIGKLTMQYNRGRQASITNELVDIITGASAL